MDRQTFNECIDQFKSARDSNGNPLSMHYFLAKHGDTVHLHRFNNRRKKSDIRSISKTVMTLVAGVVNRLSLEDEYPAFTEETLVYPMIQKVVNLTNERNEPYLETVRIKHLLTHSVGFDEVLLMRNDITNLDPHHYLDHVANSPITHEPGEYFLYSNAGFYLLSVALQEFLGEDLGVFVERELFAPLGIDNFCWERYGNYLAGATRLWLLPEDVMKFGELMLNKGAYEGRSIVREAWIDAMSQMYFRTEREDTPGATFRRYGYGLGVWVAKEHFFFGHGTDGQILAVLPEHDCILVALAHQPDMKPIERIINEIVVDRLS